MAKKQLVHQILSDAVIAIAVLIFLALVLFSIEPLIKFVTEPYVGIIFRDGS